MCRACSGLYNPSVSHPNQYRSLCTVDFVKDWPLYALRTGWKIHILKIIDKVIPITWVPFTNFHNWVYTWFHRLIPWAVVIIPVCDLIRWANLSFSLSSMQDEFLRTVYFQICNCSWHYCFPSWNQTERYTTDVWPGMRDKGGFGTETTHLSLFPGKNPVKTRPELWTFKAKNTWPCYLNDRCHTLE